MSAGVAAGGLFQLAPEFGDLTIATSEQGACRAVGGIVMVDERDKFRELIVKAITVGCMCECAYFSRLLQVYGRDTAQAFLNHTTTDQLDDLLRVFHVLDGQPEPDHRQGMYRTLNDALHARATTWSGPYFSLRWFRKGSGHLTFTRPDLVEELNRILARRFPNALAAPR